MGKMSLLNAYNSSSFFCENLITLRKRKGYTQQQIASKLGIDRTTYTKYETGSSEPGFEMLIRLSQLLDVSLDELFGGPIEESLVATVADSGTEELSRDELELLAVYRNMSADKKQQFKDELKNTSDPR